MSTVHFVSILVICHGLNLEVIVILFINLSRIFILQSYIGCIFDYAIISQVVF